MAHTSDFEIKFTSREVSAWGGMACPLMMRTIVKISGLLDPVRSRRALKQARPVAIPGK